MVRVLVKVSLKRVHILCDFITLLDHLNTYRARKCGVIKI